MSDFYEEDEPLEDIKAAWERGEKGRTAPPHTCGTVSFTSACTFNITFRDGRFITEKCA